MRIVRDISLGMQYLHHAMTPPIAHRDLRSPNVFLTGEGGEGGGVVAKVADFGMSRRGLVGRRGREGVVFVSLFGFFFFFFLLTSFFF